MQKIAEIRNDARIPEAQRLHVEARIKAIKSRKEDTLSIVMYCLQEIYISYDNGGISVGRSVRALLLEEATCLLRVGCTNEAKKLVAILVAMYYSPLYINEHGWFDFETTIELLPLVERIFLLAVSDLLEIQEVPEVSDCTIEHIQHLVGKNEAKRRALRGK